MTEYLDRYPTMHEYAEGKRINPKLTDYINRAGALEQMAQAECGLHYDDCEADNCSCSYIQRILDIPSADAVSREEYEELYRKAKEVNGMANDILADFPSYKEIVSADAVQGWIPCSERLPSMRTEVIYSFDGIVSTGYMTDRDFNGEKMELHWEDLESGATIEPIAWMPLPKPYKGGDSE